MNLSELTWVDAKKAIGEAQVGLLPIGSTENHGPHLPLGTDWFTARWLAEEVGRKGNWLVLPAVPVGVSEHHRQFWGTLWVSSRVLREYVAAICHSLAAHGLHRVVFVNGHGGNRSALADAARSLREEGVYAFVHQWWTTIDDTLEDLFPRLPEHAGPVETSAILAINPLLVKQDRYREASSIERWGSTIEGVDTALDTLDFSEQGNVVNPSGASREKGIQELEAAVTALHRFCTWLSTQPDEALCPRPHKS